MAPGQHAEVAVRRGGPRPRRLARAGGGGGRLLEALERVGDDRADDPAAAESAWHRERGPDEDRRDAGRAQGAALGRDRSLRRVHRQRRLLLQSHLRSRLEGPRAGLRARRAARLRGQSHRVAHAWALAVRRDLAEANGLRTLSDFGRWVTAGGRVVLACSAEFANAGTLRSLERTYGFTLRPEQMIVLAGGETSATIGAAAARTNGVNTAMVYGTDGGIVAASLKILEDDRHEQPVYAPVPLIREPVLNAHREIAAIVKPLMESLGTDALQRLNARVQIDGESEQSVAEDYLRAKGLLR